MMRCDALSMHTLILCSINKKKKKRFSKERERIAWQLAARRRKKSDGRMRRMQKRNQQKSKIKKRKGTVREFICLLLLLLLLGVQFFNLKPFPLFFGIAHTKVLVWNYRCTACVNRQHTEHQTHLHNLINDRNEQQQQQQQQKCAPFLCHFSVPFLCLYFAFLSYFSSLPSSPSLSPLSSLFSSSFFSAPNLRVFLAIPTFSSSSYPLLRSRLQTCSKSSLARSVCSVQYFVRWLQLRFFLQLPLPESLIKPLFLFKQSRAILRKGWRRRWGGELFARFVELFFALFCTLKSQQNAERGKRTH